MTETNTHEIIIVLFDAYHEHEQQQHQQKQHGFCDCRCNGPLTTLELFCVPLNELFSGPVLLLCVAPRSRHPDGNSDTLQDILYQMERGENDHLVAGN